MGATLNYPLVDGFCWVEYGDPSDYHTAFRRVSRHSILRQMKITREPHFNCSKDPSTAAGRSRVDGSSSE